MRCVTLTADFGLRDGFAGMMKAVILERAGHVPIGDMAATCLPVTRGRRRKVQMASFRRFAPGAAHAAVAGSCVRVGPA